MKSHLVIVFTAATTALAVHGQDLPNPSFEQPQLQPSPGFITPGSTGYGEAAPLLEWTFGFGAGVCLAGENYAKGVTAAEGRQVAFIQGQWEEHDQARPRSIFGVDITGLQPGQEYEIAWQQTGRTADTGQTAVSVILGDGQKPPLPVMTKEPVGTRGEWESKSVWFLATAPTMRLQIRHFIPEAGNSNVGSETTLFDDFKIRAGRSAD